MTDETSANVIARIAKQDRDAFVTLYRNLERPVFRFIQSRMNDPFQSADIMHDVFLEVWRNAGTFQGKSSVKTWVLAIAYRKTIDLFRRQRRIVDLDEFPDVADDDPSALECIWAAQERDMLKECLATLKPAHRAAVELTFFQDMSYGDIAAVENVPEGTVKTRVFHAKKLLLHCLQAKMKAKVRS